jgi:hypothetical protein
MRIQWTCILTPSAPLTPLDPKSPEAAKAHLHEGAQLLHQPGQQPRVHLQPARPARREQRAEALHRRLSRVLLTHLTQLEKPRAVYECEQRLCIAASAACSSPT